MNSILFKQYYFQNAMLLTLAFLLTPFKVSAQHNLYNGKYTSHKTSFQDLRNPDNSFSENAVNNIFIQVDGNSPIFAFQDERLPQNTLSYKIDSFEGHINDGEKELYIYNCTSLHKEQAKSEQITLYLNNDGSLNIMISAVFSSQVFFDLKKK